MRPTVRRRVRLFVGLLLVGALVGAVYGGVIGHLFRNTGLIGASVGTIDGVVIAAPIALSEIFLQRTQWGRRCNGRPSSSPSE